jgi:dihydrofolate reductase
VEPAVRPGSVRPSPHSGHEPLPSGRELLVFGAQCLGQLPLARASAGDRNVIVMGGANLPGQYLNAGVVDELTVSVAPVLLGSGKRLFDGPVRACLALEPAGVIESPLVTHLRYRLTSARQTW